MDRRRRIETELAPASTGYRSNAMVAEGFVFTGGHIGAPVSTPSNRLLPVETLEEQIDLSLQHMRTLILAGGGDMERVVEVSAFIIPFERASVVFERTQMFLGYPPPLYHAHAVDDVALHGMLEMDAIALVDPAVRMEQAVEILRPFGKDDGLVKSGPFIMVNKLTGAGATLGAQTVNLFREAERQLRAAGSALSNLVKLTVYLSDYDTYPEFNEATKELFATFEPPTRSVTIAPQITAGSLLLVDMIALAGSSESVRSFAVL